MTLPDRKEKRTDLSFSFLLFLGGVVITLLNSLSWPFAWLDVVQLAFMAFAFVWILPSGVLLVRSYFGHRYAVVPALLELDEFCNNLNKHYQEAGNNTEDVAAAAVRDTEERLQLEYCKMVTLNFRSNKRKTELLYCGNWGLVISSFFVILTGLPYVMRSVLGKKRRKIDVKPKESYAR